MLAASGLKATHAFHLKVNGAWSGRQLLAGRPPGW